MFRKILVSMIAVSLGISILFSPAYAYDYRKDDAELFQYIQGLCEEYKLPLALILAVIEKESSWNAEAVNYNKTCFGLMQIHKINAGWLYEDHGITDLKDPYQNVLAGIIMLSEYWEDYDADPHLALMCYNCGKTGARNLWKKGYYSSVYSRWVVGRMDKIETELAEGAYVKAAA